MRKLTAFFLFAFCLLLPGKALAVSVSINNSPSSVGSDPFNVDVSVLGASSGQNYLRAEIYKDGTSNYFGETYSGSAWYGGSTGTSYFPINITDSKTTTSASLQIRIGSPTATEFPGAGSYKLKVKRYTSSGNAASGDDESTVDLTINYSAPATPTPTPKSSTLTSSTTTKSTSTSVKTPTPTKALTASKTSGISSSSNTGISSSNQKQTVNNSDKIATDFAKIQNLSPTVGKTGDVAVLGESKKEFPWMLLITVGGLIFLGLGTGLYARNNWDKIKIWMENL